MKHAFLLLSASTTAAVLAQTFEPPAPVVQAQAAPAASSVRVPLAKDRDETRPNTSVTLLVVSSPTITAGASIPARHSKYAEGLSPGLSWSAMPGAKSYLIVLEDPDAKTISPFVHWVAWNIPPQTVRLPEGLPAQPRLTQPVEMVQGRSGAGTIGYFGVQPPAGDPPHHYHFQVFALDTMLDLPPGSDRDQVLAAVRGHVIAKGELVGRYGQRAEPR